MSTRKPKAQFLPGLEKVGVKVFGGTQLKGNPREQRPISIKKPMHLTMRSRLATGDRSFLIHERSIKIETIIHKAAKVHGVQILRFANAGNHLHIAILPKSRKAFVAFIRTISGLIARITLNKERGRAGKALKFWDARPYTRILEWGREFANVKAYLVKNTLEALGFQPYVPRKLRHSSG
jgi:REP element-mobilizing transposase RayT